MPELPLFLAVLARAGVFISGDTGPLHFAAGLGVPTISLFGPTSPAIWAPVGPRHQFLTGSPCSCEGKWDDCRNTSHCLAAITPEQVFERLQSTLTPAVRVRFGGATWRRAICHEIFGLFIATQPDYFAGEMADKIPYLDLPAQLRGIRKDIDAAIARTIDHCSFCLGPDVAQFEKDFAKFIGAEHCSGFNSGTSALHVAMLLLGVGPGDEVVTTPFTFVATSWAISYAGAKPVYVDIDDATMNLDPKLLERAITPKTKAVMPVHLYGHPFDLDPILAICRKHKLPLVEDAAQAHGAKYKGKIVGTFGDISCFSFYPGKNLGACGEGGALVTNNAAFDKRARALREHGSTVRYYHDEVGYNYRMEGIQGAVLGVKLKHLQKWTDERRRVAHRYHELLADTPLQLPREAAWAGKRLPSLRRAPSAPR